MRKLLSATRHQVNTELLNSPERFPIHILLENVRSLHNVGSIFRTCDAARVSKVHLCGYTGFPPRKEIAKTALGAQDMVPWEYYRHARDAIQNLRSEGIGIIAVEQTDAKKTLFGADFSFPVCFVFGYEIEGVSQETLDICDSAVEIPMFGFKGSLNVAVTCGIMLYDALRRYIDIKPEKTLDRFCADA
jgi:23S rRNA (guanosine2251-2'-O)-methyltransferase